MVRVRRRCRRLVVGGCTLGCSEEVEGSWFVQGFRRRIVGAAVARIGYRVEVGLVLGMENSVGRNSNLVGLAVKEGRVGFAGYRSV